MSFGRNRPSLALALTTNATLLAGLLMGCNSSPPPVDPAKVRLVQKIDAVKEDIVANSYEAAEDPRLSPDLYPADKAHQKAITQRLAEADARFVYRMTGEEADPNHSRPADSFMAASSIRTDAVKIASHASANEPSGSLQDSLYALCQFDWDAFRTAPQPACLNIPRP
jgi:hypothetical protein